MTALTKPNVEPIRTDTSYSDDFYPWTQEQGARLRAGKFDTLDIENLAKEIESLGRSQPALLTSSLRVVLVHMLKFDHRPSGRRRSWAIPRATHRINEADGLNDSTGLKNGLGEAVERAFRRARLKASKETRLPLKRLPEAFPYTLDEITMRDFAIDDDGTL